MPPSTACHPSAPDALAALRHLLAERALVLSLPLGRNGRYMADLDEEIAETRHEFVTLAVTEIAVLRASLGDRGQG